MLKFIFRLFVLLLMLGGWALAALAVHIVRVPDTSHARPFKFIIVPKLRLDYHQTYVDAINWNISDVYPNRDLLQRIIASGKLDSVAPSEEGNSRITATIEGGKIDKLAFLADPQVKVDPASQVLVALDHPVKLTPPPIPPPPPVAAPAPQPAPEQPAVTPAQPETPSTPSTPKPPPSDIFNPNN